MAEHPAHLFWRNAPRSSFENFRDSAVGLLSTVDSIQRDAAKLVLSGSGGTQFFEAANFSLPFIAAGMKAATEVWQETPIPRYLTLTDPVVFSLDGTRSRYDGCCSHEVAINLGHGVFDFLGDKATCWQYLSHLQKHAGSGGVITDRLHSLMADIRCECTKGVEQYLAEQKPAPVVAVESEMVSRQWIAERSGIPVDTLRGKRCSKLLGDPDRTEPGMPSLWKKDRALDFIAKHGKL